MSFIYLASESPRRQELLHQIGVRFELLIAGPEEDTEALEALEPGETATHYVQRVARLKADAALRRRVHRGLQSAPILAADTTVALGRLLMGKPSSAAQAQRMLRQLSGTRHRVLTAVAVTDGKTLHVSMSQSLVTMRHLGHREIRDYIDSGEPFGKAGAYAIQGKAAAFVSHLSGSFSGVVGLPLFETADLMRRFKVIF